MYLICASGVVALTHSLILSIFLFFTFLNMIFPSMALSSVGRIFQNAAPFALKLCELILDFVIGATMFKGFCSLLLNLRLN